MSKLQQCMGGYCRKREACAYYTAPQTPGLEPVERLCEKGRDEPLRDDRPRPALRGMGCCPAWSHAMTIAEQVAKMVLGNRPPRKVAVRESSWTPAEDAVMLEHYQALGPAGVLPMLPRRSRKAVILRAIKIGLSRDRGWTAAEDAQIVAHYAMHGAKHVAGLTGRTVLAVTHRAAVLGIRGDPHRKNPDKGGYRKRRKPQVATPWRDQQTVTAASKKPQATTIVCEPIITSETRVTIAPPFVDRRFAVDSAPRVVNSAECRDWALSCARVAA